MCAKTMCVDVDQATTSGHETFIAHIVGSYTSAVGAHDVGDKRTCKSARCAR